MTSDLRIDPALRSFVADELLPGLDIEPERFWAALVDLQSRFAGRIATLLARRDELQAQIDAWHREHGAGDPDAYAAFLTEIGYLVPDASRAPVASTGVDPEIAEVRRPAARGARHRAALRAQRRQRPLGLALRRASTAPTRCRRTTTSRRATTSSAARR